MCMWVISIVWCNLVVKIQYNNGLFGIVKNAVIMLLLHYCVFYVTVHLLCVSVLASLSGCEMMMMMMMMTMMMMTMMMMMIVSWPVVLSAEV